MRYIKIYYNLYCICMLYIFIEHIGMSVKHAYNDFRFIFIFDWHIIIYIYLVILDLNRWIHWIHWIHWWLYPWRQTVLHLQCNNITNPLFYLQYIDSAAESFQGFQPSLICETPPLFRGTLRKMDGQFMTWTMAVTISSLNIPCPHTEYYMTPRESELGQWQNVLV